MIIMILEKAVIPFLLYKFLVDLSHLSKFKNSTKEVVLSFPRDVVIETPLISSIFGFRGKHHGDLGRVGRKVSQ